MKQKAKKLAKWLAFIIVFMVATIVGWEQVDGKLTDWYDGEPITITRPEEPKSDYDVWLATADVQRNLQLMYQRYKLEQQEKSLKAEQEALEAAKEELRAQEMELGSLE